jgi:hypothetical protein
MDDLFLQEQDLKHFSQWGSRTPGHPENFVTPGVEVTTGLFILSHNLASCNVKQVVVSNLVVLQDVLVRVLPMQLGWHSLRNTWLPASISLTLKLSTTTRIGFVAIARVFLLVCVMQFW